MCAEGDTENRPPVHAVHVGLLIETFDNKNNESVEYTYDEYGNVTAKDVTVTGSNPSTAHTSSTYDLMGNLLTETQGSDTTAYVYDAAGRTLKSTSAGGEVTRTVYDAQGRVVQEIGPEDYDAQDDGLPSSTAYSDNTVGTRYVYAANGTLTSTTDRLDRTTTYTYNSVGSKVKEAFDIYEYYYLNHGEKWKTTIAGSIYMTCSYSNDGKYRLLQEAYANGDEKNYTYNAHGDITAIADENDNTLFAFTYDSNNVLTEKADYQRGLTYAYDGDTVEVYKTSDNTLLYSYENTSQEGENEPTTADETHFGTAISTRSSEHSIAYIAGNTEVDYEDTFTNDYLTVSTVSVGNNDVMSTEYTYDAHDNITEKSIDCGSNDIAFGYTYDSENRIVSESYNQDEVYHYYYNANDQLVRANNNLVQSSATYTYDSRGNITSKKSYESLATDVSNLTPDLKTVFTYETSGWTDRLTQVTKSIKILGTLYDYEFNTVTYDDIGNVLTYGNKSYTWENGRNLTAVTEGNNTYSYTYDEEGIRTSKTVGGTTTYFNYDNGQLLSQSDGTNTFIFQYDVSGNPSGFLYNGTQYFYITNAVGDIIAFVDSQNNFCAMYYYVDSAWGSYMEIDAATNAMRALANLNPFRYKGYYYDAETGYYYLQSRYYDPDICRFINADCYCDTGTGTVYSTNMFAYCENDPVNNVDPDGHKKRLVYVLGMKSKKIRENKKFLEVENRILSDIQVLKPKATTNFALWRFYNGNTEDLKKQWNRLPYLEMIDMVVVFCHGTELTINKIRIDEIQQLQKQSIRCLVLLSCNTGRVNESNPNNRYDNIATEFAKITGNGLVVAPNGFCSYSNYRNSNIQLPFTCFLEIPGNIKYTYWRIYRGNNNRLYFNTQQSLLSMKYLIELIRLKGWVSL